MTALAERPVLLYPLFTGVAALLGAITYAQPRIAVGLVGVVIVTWTAYRRPVGNLLALIFLTAIVPYSVQKLVGVSRPGLLPSDLLLMIGIAWALVTVSRMPLDRRWVAFGAVLVVYMAWSVIQAVHGFRVGANPSDIGFELRIQLGFGAFLIAVPVLRDPVRRARLWRGLLILAIVLGAWGVLQYMVTIPFGGAQDFGVRQGVALTSGGRGQVQGGLYGFGPTLVLCAAALLSGAVTSHRARQALWLAVLLNIGGLLFTFERTFWVAAILGVGWVVVRAGRAQRARALVFLPLAAIVALAALSIAAPNEFTTARERLLSIGQYTSDNSVRYRVVESRHVADQIKAHPLLGSGLGTTIYWGQPWQRTPAVYTTYTHNGYFWLLWKQGIPFALVLFGLMGVAAFAFRRPPPLPPLERGMRNGAQAALMALLISSVTFPVFNTLAITAVIGVLLAIACLPPREEPAVEIV
ncbi:MAG: O-antigen ligase protein [Solirubrobacterales bacterium]|nr:O-antigen ligase protein [Solirubrobacterales bacterium]